MDNNIRTANDVENRIKESIAYYEDRITAWKAVKRLSKKDGSDFTVFSKNFENARIYAPYGIGNKFVVNFKDRAGRWHEDYIDIYNSVDEQFTAINALIERYTAWKEENEKELALAAELAEFALAKIREIKAEYEKTGLPFRGSLYYSIGDLIENSKYFERV